MSEPLKQLGDYVTVMTSLTDLRKSASTSSAKCLETGEATVPDVDHFEGSDDVTNRSGSGICDVTKVELTNSDLPSFDCDYDDDDVFDNDDAKVPDSFKHYKKNAETQFGNTSDSYASDEDDAHTVKESESSRTPSDAYSSSSGSTSGDEEPDNSSSNEKSNKSDKSSESDESESDSDLRIKVLDKLNNIRISKPKKVHFTVIVEERIEYEVTNYQHEGRCTMWVPKLTDKNKEE